MKRKPVDVTGWFDDYIAPIYNSSKEYLEVQDLEELVRILYLASDSNNFNNADLLYITELNYKNFGDDNELDALDQWQINGLKAEVEQAVYWWFKE